MFDDVFSIDNLPTLDLHGEIGQVACIRVDDFVRENYLLGKKYLIIIHGKGSGIIKNVTLETLKKNKLVDEYKLYYYNDGCTIVKLKQKV